MSDKQDRILASVIAPQLLYFLHENKTILINDGLTVFL
jgi:hypothetical protein